MAAKLKSVSIALLLTLLAILPAEPRLARATGPWYVAPGGSDGDSCASPAAPCATINAAIAKASPGDTILVATGTYTGTGSSVVVIDKDVTLSGGWDESFTGAAGRSVIDGEAARRGVEVDLDVSATISRLAIENGHTGSWGGGIGLVRGSLVVNNSIIRNNYAYAGAGGIAVLVYSTLTVRDSAITGNTSPQWGGGIRSDYSTVIIENSTVSGNHTDSGGGGISKSGDVGSVSLYSTSITSNSASLGGGIWAPGGGVTLQNTILANNSSTGLGPDCYGMITASGYSLVGDTADCDLLPTTGDLTGVDPKLGPLQDNGGSTLTQALLSGSLAIDGGDPAGCTGYLGNLLTTDQRGLSRYGRCDIGAYEWQPAPAGPYAVYLPLVLRPPCGTRLFYDDFSNPASGWPIGDDTNVQYAYLSNEYRILVKSAGMWAGATPGFKASDYVLVVDARKTTSVEGAYGLLFGLADDWSRFYAFEVEPTGYYGIWYVQVAGTSSTWVLLAGGPSASIHTGTATNQLKIERKGAQMWAYVNGELLNILSSGGSTGLKRVGLIAESFGQANLDARFDNFTLYPMSCGAAGASVRSEGGPSAVEEVEGDLLKHQEGSHDRSALRR